MAQQQRTDEGSAAQQHRAQQAVLATALATQVADVFTLLSLTALAATMPGFLAAMVALINRYSTASGALAADYYELERTLAAVPGRYTARIADPPSIKQIESSVRWATDSLWSSEAFENLPAVRTLTEGATEKLVLDVGRDTILTNVHADEEALGWARVARPDACYFCAMLASRGPVYHTAQTAGRGRTTSKAGTVFTGDGEAKYHNSCRCGVMPVFTTPHEESAQVREWQGLWKRVTANKSGRDAVIAFRHAIEKRNTQ